MCLGRIGVVINPTSWGIRESVGYWLGTGFPINEDPVFFRFTKAEDPSPGKRALEERSFGNGYVT